MAFKADLVAALQALPPAVKQQLQALRPRLGVENPTLADVADYMIRNLKADCEYELSQQVTKPTVPLD